MRSIAGSSRSGHGSLCLPSASSSSNGWRSTVGFELNVTTDPQLSGLQSQPNPHYTDIASALQLAGSILPGDTRRHVVLVSDGRGNLGDAIGEARLLRAEGVRVDAVAINVPQGAEVLVDHLDAPRSLAVGQRADVTAAIAS